MLAVCAILKVDCTLEGKQSIYGRYAANCRQLMDHHRSGLLHLQAIHTSATEAMCQLSAHANSFASGRHEMFANWIASHEEMSLKMMRRIINRPKMRCRGDTWPEPDREALWRRIPRNAARTTSKTDAMGSSQCARAGALIITHRKSSAALSMKMFPRLILSFQSKLAFRRRHTSIHGMHSD